MGSAPASLHSNEKLVSMGRVIASIAHEIRNPLGIIRSSAELLQRRMGKADAGTSRILQAIYDESVRLSQTVNDFLDYARPRQPRQDLVDLDLVLSQVLAFLEGELGRVGVAIERATSPGLWVRGDKDLLYRAIYNILVNGQQAMDGPGIIRISSRRSDDGRVVLEALDSGPGSIRPCWTACWIPSHHQGRRYGPGPAHRQFHHQQPWRRDPAGQRPRRRGPGAHPAACGEAGKA